MVLGLNRKLKSWFKLDISGRNFGWDVMRAVAILLVLGSHAFHIIANHVPKSISNIFLPDGVDIFFVLSGFLVGRIWFTMVQQSQNIEWSLFFQFYKRRWFRTVPVYLVVISALFLYRWIASDFCFQWPWQYFTFTQNFYASEWDPYFFYPEGWSLSVEEWFYLSMPIFCLLILFCFKNKMNVSLLVISFYIVVPLVLRLYAYHHGEILDLIAWNRDVRRLVIYRLDSIGWGLLMAWIFVFNYSLWDELRKWTWLSFTLLILVILLAQPSFIQVSYLSTFYFSLFAFSLSLLMPSLELLKSKSKKIIRFITYTSLFSYSIYLLNRTFIYRGLFMPYKSLFDSSIAHAVFFYIIFYLLVFVVAAVFYFLLERPLIKLRDRF